MQELAQAQHWGLRQDHQEDPGACLVCRLEEPGAAAVVGLDRMVDAAGVSVTSVIWDFQSFLGYVGEAGGCAACADPADETSTMGSMTWAVAGSMRGAGYMAIAEAPAQKRMVCSTWTAASDLEADHRLAAHAGRVVVIVQMQVS